MCAAAPPGAPPAGPTRQAPHSSLPRRKMQRPPFSPLTGHVKTLVSSQWHVRAGPGCLSGTGRRRGPISRRNVRALLKPCTRRCERVRYVFQLVLPSAITVQELQGQRPHQGGHWRPPWRGPWRSPLQRRLPSHLRQRRPRPSKNTTRQQPRGVPTQRTKRASKKASGCDARRAQT